MYDLFGSALDTYPDTPTHQQIVNFEKEGMSFTNVTTEWWGSHPGINEELGKLIQIVLKH